MRAGSSLGLPGAGRRLEAFELREHGDQRIRPARPRRRRYVLPVEQEAHEVARLDRLDLAAQPLERVAMDARQQVPLAPFVVAGARA